MAVWCVAKVCNMASYVREWTRLHVLRAGGVVVGCGCDTNGTACCAGTLGGGSCSSSLSSSSETTGSVGSGVGIGILGGGAWLAICWGGAGVFGCCLAVSLKRCYRHCRSCSFLIPMCCALAFCWMTCARFAAAAMSASAGDMDGFVRYLCLKNTVAAMRMVRVAVDHIFQHL